MRVTKPTNLTLSETVKEKAKRLMGDRGHKSLTSLVEELIRQKHDQIFGVTPNSVKIVDRAERAGERLAESLRMKRTKRTPPDK